MHLQISAYQCCPPNVQPQSNPDECKHSIPGLSKLSLDSFVKEEDQKPVLDASDGASVESNINGSVATGHGRVDPALDEARQRQLDLEIAVNTPIPTSLPRERSSSSAAASSYLSSSTEETSTINSIPSQTFSMIFVDFLLDQNSNLATYCQQCIVNIASHLSYIATTEDETSTSITADMAKDLLRTEIFEGVIMNLYNITRGQQPFQSRQQALDDQIPDGSTDHPQSLDEGEMNLAKMMCLSVSESSSVLAGD